MSHYDALVVISFGGPEGPDDVLPFLENVLRGKNVPRARMLEVAEHYQHFGGVSPINGQNRDLIAAVERLLNAEGPRIPVYWGNRNWRPLLADTFRQMAADGVRSALAFVTSAYASYSGCRQYLEDIEQARAAVGPGAPRIDKLRVFYNHPDYIAATAERVAAAFAKIPSEGHAATALVFSAHSIPLAMATTCDYERQLREAAALVAGELGVPAWRLVYQSRSGPPTQPWLEPDIGDALRELHSQGTRDVVVMPLGFLSDHMEVVYDLDTEAQQICADLGVNMVRANTVGHHPRIVAMICKLIVERLEPGTVRESLGAAGPYHDNCPATCCAYQPRRPAPA